MYFVTALKFSKIAFVDNRCFGYFHSKEQAMDAVLNNTGNICDFLYDYAVIEHIEAGIHPLVEEEIWFQFDNKKNGWYKIEDKPFFLKNTINFAIG